MADLRQEEFIAAAVATFAARGYPATTVDDLCAAAGVGPETFKQLGMDKETCLLVAYDGIVEEARKAASARAASAGTWPERIYLGLEGLLSWIPEHPSEAKVALTEIHATGAAGLIRREQTVNEAMDLLRVGREKSPTAREAPQVLEQALVEGTAYVLSTRLAERDRDSIPQLCPELAWLILRPYMEAGEIERVVACHR